MPRVEEGLRRVCSPQASVPPVPRVRPQLLQPEVCIFISFFSIKGFCKGAIHPLKEEDFRPLNPQKVKKLGVNAENAVRIAFSLHKFSCNDGLMENTVAMHLLRKNQLKDVNYLWGEDYEVDFVDGKGDELVVSYVSSLDEVNRNEIRSLVKGSEAVGSSRLTLVSWDLEDEVITEGKKVRIIPL
jgi:hypothetical protein